MENVPDDNPAPIRTSLLSLYNLCIASFKSLIAVALQQSSKQENERSLSSPQIDLLQDEFGRFKVWAANCGAHRKGRVSLDHRLREAPHVYDTVASLLRDLRKASHEASMIITEDTSQEPKDNLLAATASTATPDDQSSTDSDSDSSSSFVISDDDGLNPTDLEYALQDISHVIKCLYRFSVALRQPALRDRLKKCAGIDVSHYEFWDILHVRDKFPGAANYLAERLGKANMKRRQLLIYYQRHHDKIARYIDADPILEATGTLDRAIGEPIDTREEMPMKYQEELSPSNPARTVNLAYTTTVIQSGTSVTTFKQLPGTTINVQEDLDQVSDDGQSRTSYSTSLSSQSESKLRVPSIPAEALKGPFVCPYCYDTIHTKGTRAWIDHVFKDLMPYVCTFQDCPKPDHLYDSMREWYLHETEYHRREWYCASSTCNQSFLTKQLLIQHMGERHLDTVSEAEMSTVADRCERGILSEQECPLCLTNHTSMKLRQHLGRHMQQLALFTLPRDKSRDEDEESERSDATQLELGQEELSSWGSRSRTTSSEKRDEPLESKLADNGPQEGVNDSKTSDPNVLSKGDNPNVPSNPPSITSQVSTASQSQIPTKILLNMPATSPAFIGRGSELQVMFDYSISRRWDVVVFGEEGIGKSALVAEYIRLYNQHYSSIICLDASTDSNLESGFVQIAENIALVAQPTSQIKSGSEQEKCGKIVTALKDYKNKISQNLASDTEIDSIVSSIHEWLFLEENKNWLLYFDNLPPSPSHPSWKKYVPAQVSGHGSIIITIPVKNTEEKREDTRMTYYLAVHGFEPEEAVNYLYRIIHVREILDLKRSDLFEICQHFEYNPKKLLEAGQEIELFGNDLRKYLEVCEARKTVKSVLFPERFGRRDEEAERSPAFEKSLRECLDTVWVSHGAGSVLSLFAFLVDTENGASLPMLMMGHNILRSLMQQLHNFSDANSKEEINETSVLKAIVRNCIGVVTDDYLVIPVPVVKTVRKRCLWEDTIWRVIRTVVSTLGKHGIRSMQEEDFEEELCPHIDALEKLLREMPVERLDSLRSVDFELERCALGALLADHGRDVEALQIYSSSYDCFKRIPRLQQASTASPAILQLINRRIGSLYEQKEDYENAGLWYFRGGASSEDGAYLGFFQLKSGSSVLHTSSLLRGLRAKVEDTDGQSLQRLRAMTYYAMTLTAIDRGDEALEECEKAHLFSIEIGERNPYEIASLHLKAMIYYQLGRVDEANSLREEAQLKWKDEFPIAPITQDHPQFSGLDRDGVWFKKVEYWRLQRALAILTSYVKWDI